MMKRLKKVLPRPLASTLLFMLLDLKPQAYAWPIIIYSKQDISQLRDDCKTFVENLFDNSGYTVFSIFSKTVSM